MEKRKPKSQQCLEPEGMNRRRFIALNRNLLNLGFKKITDKIIKKNLKKIDFKMVEQLKKQEGFYYRSKEYYIVVLTSFDQKLGEQGGFALKNRGWVIIIDDETGRQVYCRRFNRTIMDNFINYLSNESEFLVDRLKKRPRVEGTKLFYKIRQTIEPVWISPLGNGESKVFYLKLTDSHLSQHYFKLNDRIKRYQEKKLQRVMSNVSIVNAR